MPISINGTGTITGITAGGLPDGIITRAEMGFAGAILQVVQTVLTSTVSVSGSAWNEITSLATSITPSSSSSKILIMPSIDWAAGSGYRAGFKMVRGSTDILLGNTDSNRLRVSQIGRFFDTANQMLNQANRIYLDSPSTTSSTTYKFYLTAEQDTGATIYINRTVADVDNNTYHRGTSTITLMEVAA